MDFLLAVPPLFEAGRLWMPPVVEEDQALGRHTPVI
jgi:hypothetical protein